MKWNQEMANENPRRQKTKGERGQPGIFGLKQIDVRTVSADAEPG